MPTYFERNYVGLEGRTVHVPETFYPYDEDNLRGPEPYTASVVSIDGQLNLPIHSIASMVHDKDGSDYHLVYTVRTDRVVDTRNRTDLGKDTVCHALDAYVVSEGPGWLSRKLNLEENALLECNGYYDVISSFDGRLATFTIVNQRTTDILYRHELVFDVLQQEVVAGLSGIVYPTSMINVMRSPILEERGGSDVSAMLHYEKSDLDGTNHLYLSYWAPYDVSFDRHLYLQDIEQQWKRVNGDKDIRYGVFKQDVAKGTLTLFGASGAKPVNISNFGEILGEFLPMYQTE